MKTKEDALKIVNYYKQRWHIENFFKVLKGGCCKVEYASLRTFERLEKYTTAFSVLAWKLYWAKHINEVDPNAPAEFILSPPELKSIELRIKKRNKRKNIKKIMPPVKTVRDAIRFIASLGGFNGRKGDGEPGIITLWRGFMKLQIRAEAFEEIAEEYNIIYH